MRDDFSEGRFIVIAPELNTQVQSGIQKYAGTLVTPKVGQVAFSAISLERMTELLSECGELAYARKFHERYCDWSKIDDVIEAEIAAMGSVTAGNDNAANGRTTTASAVA
jgi:hypothetical protein